jgi:type II secretion system protein I
VNRQGFTLLEVLVATLIMGLAVVGLLTGIHTSLRNAARLTDYDRAALLARSKLNELMVEPRLPIEGRLEGNFDPKLTGGEQSGWIANMRVAEAPPQAGPGSTILQAVDLDVWWQQGANRRQMDVHAYRPNRLPPAAQ